MGSLAPSLSRHGHLRSLHIRIRSVIPRQNTSGSLSRYHHSNAFERTSASDDCGDSVCSCFILIMSTRCIYIETHLNRKSILLFVVACASTTITFILQHDISIMLQMRIIFSVSSTRIMVILVDQIVNAICLYLQFGFTRRVYFKCCGYPHSCCVWCLSWKIKRWQKQRVVGRLELSSLSTSAACNAGASLS